MFSWLKNLLNKHGTSPKAKGAYWEKVAAKALAKDGFKIVAKNWMRKGAHGELDLVAKDGDILVFVEVRSRGSAALVSGFHSINRHKREVLRETCNAYMSKLRKRPLTFRFDVVEISYKSEDDYELRHFKNVPLFG